MALISCPECAKQYSDTAAACPNCGYRAPTPTGLLTFERKGQVNGALLKFDVFVNGDHLGSIRPGGDISIELPMGRYDTAVVNRYRDWQCTGRVDIEPGINTVCAIRAAVLGGIKVEVDDRPWVR